MGSAEVLRCGEDDWDGLRASIITAMEREQRGQHVKEELDVSDTDTDINEPGEVVEIHDFVERVWAIQSSIAERFRNCVSIQSLVDALKMMKLTQ